MSFNLSRRRRSLSDLRWARVLSRPLVSVFLVLVSFLGTVLVESRYVFTTNRSSELMCLTFTRSPPVLSSKSALRLASASSKVSYLESFIQVLAKGNPHVSLITSFLMIHTSWDLYKSLSAHIRKDIVQISPDFTGSDAWMEIVTRFRNVSRCAPLTVVTTRHDRKDFQLIACFTLT